MPIAVIVLIAAIGLGYYFYKNYDASRDGHDDEDPF